jgi:hypothetical protein
MFRWFMVIGVAVIVFSFFVQSRISDIIKPDMDLRPAIVETKKSTPVDVIRIVPPENVDRPAQTKERLQYRVPPQKGNPVSEGNIPM